MKKHEQFDKGMYIVKIDEFEQGIDFELLKLKHRKPSLKEVFLGDKYYVVSIRNLKRKVPFPKTYKGLSNYGQFYFRSKDHKFLFSFFL